MPRAAEPITDPVASLKAAPATATRPPRMCHSWPCEVSGL